MTEIRVSRTAFAALLLAGALALASAVSAAALAQGTPVPQAGVFTLQNQGSCVLGQTGPNQTIMGTKYALVSAGMIRSWCSKEPVRLCDARTGSVATGGQACPPGSSTLVTPKPVDQTPIPPRPQLSEAEQQLADLRQAIAEARSGRDEPAVGIVSEYTGDVSLVLPTGRTVSLPQGMGSIGLTDANGDQLALPQGTAIVTSNNGAASLLFADNTVFSISKSTRLNVDEFYYEDDGSGSSFFSMLQGVFVYTSGLIGKNDPENVNITFPGGAGGIRGTKFEVKVNADKSGHVKLFEGLFDYTPKGGGKMVSLKAGQMITFDKRGKPSSPKKF